LSKSKFVATFSTKNLLYGSNFNHLDVIGHKLTEFGEITHK